MGKIEYKVTSTLWLFWALPSAPCSSDSDICTGWDMAENYVWVQGENKNKIATAKEYK